MSDELSTVREIIDVLGGNAEVARLFGISAKAPSNWISAGQMPPGTYPVIKEELWRQKKTAPDKLWSFRQRISEVSP